VSLLLLMLLISQTCVFGVPIAVPGANEEDTTLTKGMVEAYVDDAWKRFAPLAPPPAEDVMEVAAPAAAPPARATSGLAFMFSVQPPVPAGRTRVGAFPTGNAGNGGFAAAHQRAPVPRAQPFRRPDSELDMYRREPAVSLADYDFDLLDYWKVKSKIYPHLGKMARQYLACPASSANVERLFSPVTAMHSDLRKSTLERTFQRTIRVRMEGRP
jgi:hypothetical protein